MELSKPHLRSSDLPISIASDSQILGTSSFSPSLPSEPPELGNWFPNYQYESPLLDTNYEFGDSVSKKIETGHKKFSEEQEENLKGFNEVGKKDETLVGQKLKSNGSSECYFGNDKDEKQCLSENVDSACSASLHSEPIDVEQWFSSYVYESPILDTADGFKDSLAKETECEDNESMVEESKRNKAKEYREFRRIKSSDDGDISNGLGNYDKTCEYYKHGKQSPDKNDSRSGRSSQILAGETDVCFESALTKCLEYTALQNQEIRPAKDVELPNLDQEDHQRRLNFSNTMEYVKDSEAKGHIEVEPSFLSPKTKSGNLESAVLMVNGASIEKSTGGCDDKENDREETSKDGFVTTRKGRFSKENEENLFELPKQNKRGAVSLAGGKGSVVEVERKALAERTNFSLSRAPETTGKWHCPQKRKPNLGPPLKQLRLERWVQRL
ncbi:uncharacterized protein LOC133833946 [Humulus lupulus]|uniref:uncharacterized protein LOC133833946 n=1 Tax=Humulus lupulus TaxID=3486 RepID=UPI002B415008|nr:uncharacterized protein LOC133833946 [Humulus lupulus]